MLHRKPEASERLGVSGRAGAEALVAATVRHITAACEASMPRKRPRHDMRPAYWWTPEIAEQRRTCLELRRAAQRARNREEAHAKSERHKAAKKQLRRAINQSKVRC